MKFIKDLSKLLAASVALLLGCVGPGYSQSSGPVYSGGTGTGGGGPVDLTNVTTDINLTTPGASITIAPHTTAGSSLVLDEGSNAGLHSFTLKVQDYLGTPAGAGDLVTDHVCEILPDGSLDTNAAGCTFMDTYLAANPGGGSSLETLSEVFTSLSLPASVTPPAPMGYGEYANIYGGNIPSESLNFVRMELLPLSSLDFGASTARGRHTANPFINSWAITEISGTMPDFEFLDIGGTFRKLDDGTNTGTLVTVGDENPRYHTSGLFQVTWKIPAGSTYTVDQRYSMISVLGRRSATGPLGTPGFETPLGPYALSNACGQADLWKQNGAWARVLNNHFSTIDSFVPTYPNRAMNNAVPPTLPTRNVTPLGARKWSSAYLESMTGPGLIEDGSYSPGPVVATDACGTDGTPTNCASNWQVGKVPISAVTPAGPTITLSSAASITGDHWDHYFMDTLSPPALEGDWELGLNLNRGVTSGGGNWPEYVNFTSPANAMDCSAGASTATDPDAPHRFGQGFLMNAGSGSAADVDLGYPTLPLSTTLLASSSTYSHNFRLLNGDIVHCESASPPAGTTGSTDPSALSEATALFSSFTTGTQVCVKVMEAGVKRRSQITFYREP